jgi:hypothetical protein
VSPAITAHRDTLRSDFEIGDVMGRAVLRIPVGGS